MPCGRCRDDACHVHFRADPSHRRVGAAVLPAGISPVDLAPACHRPQRPTRRSSNQKPSPASGRNISSSSSCLKITRGIAGERSPGFSRFRLISSFAGGLLKEETLKSGVSPALPEAAAASRRHAEARHDRLVQGDDEGQEAEAASMRVRVQQASAPAAAKV